jgi:NADH-quinone oxidoreductase subunit L
MPLTAGAFIVAWLAISGMPPFSGFWSKDEVLAKAFSAHDYGVWAVGFVAAAVTAMYMTREVWLTFFGNERFRAPAAAEELELDPGDDITHSPTVAFGESPRLPRLEHDPHDPPRVMRTPVLILAGLAVVAGVFSLPFRGVEFLAVWLEPVFEDVPAVHTSFLGGVALSVISVAIGLVGIVVAYTLYRDGLRRPADDPALARLGVVGRVFGHAYYFDETIGRIVAGPLTRLSDWLDRTVDAGIIDGAVNGIGRLVRDLGSRVRRVQTGLVRNYALGIMVGAVALLVFMLVRGG